MALGSDGEYFEWKGLARLARMSGEHTSIIGASGTVELVKIRT